MELGYAALGYLSQMTAIALLTSAVFRFGCNTAIGKVIISRDAPVGSHRSIGFSYVILALARSLSILVPATLLGFLIWGLDLAVLALSVLYAINLSFSFVERALGKHFGMVLMDTGVSFVVLAMAFYIANFMLPEPMAVIKFLVVIEGIKLLTYAILSCREFDLGNFDRSQISLSYRLKYTLSEILSVLSNGGIQIYLPLIIGATNSGVFFILQRLGAPLLFLLNVVNSVIVSRIVKNKGDIKRVFLNSVRELVFLGVIFIGIMFLFQGQILDMFNIREYDTEFAIIILGVFMNLLTGASAAVFNSVGRPEFNLKSNLLFIAFFVISTLALYGFFEIGLYGVALAFLAASTLRNVVVFVGLKKLQNDGTL
ncbi:MAG: hypothetical protein ABJF50_24650 [Paracoccaceae bacterium]